MVELRTEDDAITVWADRGGFGGDILWYKVVVGPCGDGTPHADRDVYHRYTEFGEDG